MVAAADVDENVFFVVVAVVVVNSSDSIESKTKNYLFLALKIDRLNVAVVPSVFLFLRLSSTSNRTKFTTFRTTKERNRY